MPFEWPDISQNQLMQVGLGLMGSGFGRGQTNPFQAAAQGLVYGSQADKLSAQEKREQQAYERQQRLEQAWAGMFGAGGTPQPDMAGMSPAAGAAAPQIASADPGMGGMGPQAAPGGPQGNPMLAGLPQGMAPLLAAMGPEQGASILMDRFNRKPEQRRIIQGADGFNYYEDTKERVLPGDEKPPEKPPAGYRRGEDGNLEADPGWLVAELELRRVGRNNQTISVGGGDKFGEEFAKSTVSRLSELEGKAQDAVATLQGNQEALGILDQGIISGPGADWRLQAAKLAEQAGFDTSDPVAATEAYFSNRAKAVALMVKNFGAGAGITDADREFASKAAGGDIAMTEKSMRRILDINNKVARYQIKQYNDYAGRVRKMRPGEGEFILDVEMPDIPEAPKAAQIPPPAERTIGSWYTGPNGRGMWTAEGWIMEGDLETGRAQ
jgi:hypothetical protein